MSLAPNSAGPEFEPALSSSPESIDNRSLAVTGAGELALDDIRGAGLSIQDGRLVYFDKNALRFSQDQTESTNY